MALSMVAFALEKSRAEFPPEGAVTDPNNSSIATGDLPDPSHKGGLRHYIFYFDCTKRAWIGVSVTNTKTDASSPPQAVGLGREFPPGPPLGAKKLSGSSNRAIVAATGQTFVLENGSWLDTKTRKPMHSPNLCPENVVPRVQRPATSAASPSRGSQQGTPDVDKLPPSGPVPKSEPKPDQLPPPPKDLSGPPHS